METLFILVGLILGLTIGYVIHLRAKAKFISKTEFESLNVQFQEANNSLIRSEERYKSSKDANDSYAAQIFDKDTEISNLQKELNSLKELASEYRASENAQKKRLEEYQTEKQELENKIKEQTTTITGQIEKISELTNNNKFLNEKLENHKTEIIELQKNAQLTFEKIANEILEEKTNKFTESNKINLDTLLKPLGENIEKFKKQVEETYDRESKERYSLGEKVKDLIEQTNKVSNEANNLATALKGQGKKQGNWGEIILESILERSGIVKNREYFVQPTIQGEDGKNLRPDILVHLPDKRVIIIDSKVSLVAYDRFYSSENTEEQSINITEHLKSIKTHIDDLSNKKYDDLEYALDFTMMFVPIEPAYLLAIQSDPELWSYAYNKRILLISPTNLIACLKLIADLWKREMQSKNAMEIVKRGELMYEKLVTFTETMEDIGKHINNSQNAYNKAVSQLKDGRGNLISQAQLLKSLGLKSNKIIPQNMASSEESEENSSSTNSFLNETNPDNQN